MGLQVGLGCKFRGERWGHTATDAEMFGSMADPPSCGPAGPGYTGGMSKGQQGDGVPGWGCGSASCVFVHPLSNPFRP